MRTLANPAVHASLASRIRSLTPGHRAVWGTMNAQQMALHIGDAFAAVLKQREFAARPGAKPSWFRRFALLYLVPQVPRGVRTAADPAGVVVDPATFERDRDRAAALLDQLAAAPPDTLVSGHPMFGAMSRDNWMRWAWLHTDHHLRQFGV